MTKSPDPPPKPREPLPGNSENEVPKPMNFAQKVKFLYNIRAR